MQYSSEEGSQDTPGAGATAANETQLLERSSSGGILIYRHPRTAAPLKCKPKKPLNIYKRSPQRSGSSLPDNLMQQLGQDRSSTFSLNYHANGSSTTHMRLHGHQPCSWGSPPEACGQAANCSSSSSSGRGAMYGSAELNRTVSQQMLQQQGGRSPSSFPGTPLLQPPNAAATAAAMSVMANVSKALLRLAAEHASPAAAIKLKQQLLLQLRQAAEAATVAGQCFNIADAIEQLLPGLQEAVLHECKEAHQQRNTAAATAAVAPAAAALKVSNPLNNPVYWQHSESATAAAAATDAAVDEAVIRSSKAALNAAVAAAVAAAGAPGHESSIWAAPLAAETRGVPSETLRASQLEDHDEHHSEAVHQQQQQQWTQLQLENAGSSGSGSDSKRDGLGPQQRSASDPTPNAAAGSGAAAASSDVCDGVPGAPLQLQLQLLLKAIDMLQQQ